MNDFQKKFLLKRQDYGLLYPYLVEELVTDIDWNGRQLWIDDLEKGRYMSSDVLTNEFVEHLTYMLKSIANQPFNRRHPFLEAETEELRIHAIHESVTNAGTILTFRKTPIQCRMSEEGMIKSEYCSHSMLEALQLCMKNHLNIAICGVSGAGKTELLKFMTNYINHSEKVLVVEELSEIHYSKRNVNKDCVELKLAKDFDYEEVVNVCLRQSPDWIVWSDVRDRRSKYLFDVLSAGMSGLFTIAVNDVKKVPTRIADMLGEEKNISHYIDVAILVKDINAGQGKPKRRIEQIALFREKDVVFLVDEGEVLVKSLGGLF